MNMTSDQVVPGTVGETLQYCVNALNDSDVFYGHGTDNAWDEALQLVLSVANIPLDAGPEVLPLPLSDSTRDEAQRLLDKRIRDRIPLPYLLGRAWFAGSVFKCDERAIVPRSPIAELINKEFAPWYSGPKPKRIMDLCCGGGCIGIAAAKQFPEASVDLLDVSTEALSLAQDNIALHQLGDRVRTVQSDVFSAAGEERYDIFLCNPPYVNAIDLDAMPPEFHREPELSLGSGTDGLALTRRILADIGVFLQPHSLIVLEVGYSWPALEQAYPQVPFTWVEFEHGGEGVCVISAQEWQDYSASFCG